MKFPTLPLLASAMIVLSSLASGFAADKYSEFYDVYSKAEKDRDYATVARMTLPADLDTFKQHAVEAYKRAKTELAEKGETRSLTVTTFPNLEMLEKLPPADVYMAFRNRLAPPEGEARAEFKYAGFHKDGDVGVIELTFQPEAGEPEKKALIYVREADGLIFLRLPDSIFRDL